jgi:hypothetical protein
VFDLSAIQGRVEALEFALRPDAQVDAAFRVDASEDLQQWRTITPRAQVLSLQQEGRRLARTDVALEQASRYLRLMPLDAAPALPILRVDARIASPLKDAPWQWQALHTASSVADAKGFEFDLAGPFPIERVDVASSGNAAIEWRVESRADDGTPWIVRAGPWIAYRVSDKAGAAASAPVEIFGGAVRDRYWRLTAQSGRPTESPTLRLGYRPEVVVFLAQGKPPYALVAGSARARRVDAPLVNLVEAMQQQRGDTWRPAAATLAAGTAARGRCRTRTAHDAAGLAPDAVVGRAGAGCAGGRRPCAALAAQGPGRTLNRLRACLLRALAEGDAAEDEHPAAIIVGVTASPSSNHAHAMPNTGTR